MTRICTWHHMLTPSSFGPCFSLFTQCWNWGFLREIPVSTFALFRWLPPPAPPRESVFALSCLLNSSAKFPMAWPFLHGCLSITGSLSPTAELMSPYQAPHLCRTHCPDSPHGPPFPSSSRPRFHLSTRPCLSSYGQARFYQLWIFPIVKVSI